MNTKNKWLIGIGGLIAVAAGFFLIKKGKCCEEKETPPKKAPQIAIENPGTQDEFPTSASESELG